MSDYLDSSGSSINCNPSFTWAIQNWELESLDSFLNLFYLSKTHPGEADRMLWTLASNNDFEVKSYKTLLIANPNLFPWRSVWKVKAPPHISFSIGRRLWLIIL